MIFPLEEIKLLRKELATHPIYSAVSSIDDLTLFMQHHVYSVWDFMSLVKYLQNEIAPAKIPWLSVGDAQIRRFMNEIVLEEESDEGLPLTDGTPTYTSHFELYLNAIEEINKGGATQIKNFIHEVKNSSLAIGMENGKIPQAAKIFMQTTFEFIQSNKPHVVAAAFALGREHIIPEMFRALIEKMNITREEAPTFYYYLERHIHLDSDLHGPMSLRMLEILCEDDMVKITEAQQAAMQAIRARIQFWDNVLLAIQKSY